MSGLKRHIETAHEYAKGSRELTFVYWFSHESWKTFLSLQNDSIRKFCEKSYLDIPSLNERLPDLAEYASRLTHSYARRLKRPKRQGFSADAINLLLSTQWTGNYSQMALALFKVVSIGGDEEITADELSKCISGEAVESVKVQKGADQLKSFLCNIQNRFIQRSSDESNMKVASYYSEDEELLYPDLVSPDPEAAA